MTLRAGLLTLLALVGVGSLGLFIALTRQDGLGIPGGTRALEASLSPYVRTETLRFSPPRIMLAAQGGAVEMTIRALRLDTKDGGASVLLEDIGAEVDSARLAEGTLRFKSVRIQTAQVTLHLRSGAKPQGADNGLMPQTVLKDVNAVYAAAFSEIGLDRLSAFEVGNFIVVLESEDVALAKGQGNIALEPATRQMKFISALDWTSSEFERFQLQTQVSASGAPGQPLTLSLKANIKDAVFEAFDGAYELKNAQIKAELRQSDAKDGVVKMFFTADEAGIDNSAVFAGLRAFKNASLTAVYAADNDRLSIDLVSVPLGKATLLGSILINGFDDGGKVQVDTRIDDLDVAALTTYWPSRLAPNAVRWISANIERGLLANAAIVFNSDLAAIRGDSVPFDALSISFDMRNMDVHYRRPMPPLVDASGSAKMNLDEILLSVASGTINGVNASGSKILLTSFNKNPQIADIKLRVKGSATALAQTLDSEPLGYFSAYGISPAALSGQFEGEATLKLPLINTVRFDDITVTADIRSERLVLEDILGGDAIMFQRPVIDLTDKSMSLKSEIASNGLLADLTWDEDFTGQSQSPTAMRIAGEMTAQGVARWLPYLREDVSGKIQFNGQYFGRGADLSQLQVTADLEPFAIALPELGYSKQSGQRAGLAVSLSGDAERIAIDTATLNGPNLNIALGGSFLKDGSGLTLTAPDIDSPSFKGTLNLSQQEDDWLLAGTADILDLQPVIDLFWAGELTKVSDAAASGGSNIISVSITIDELKLLKDQSTRETRLLGRFKGDRIQQMNLFGDGPGGAPFTMTVEPNSYGRRFVIASDNAGELASGLGILETATGGALNIQASSFDDENGTIISGLMTMDDIRLREASILTKLLGLGSFRGIADLARDRGIRFDTVEVPFELRGGIVRVIGASAKGASMGLTADGEFLDSLEQCDIRGVIVPSYALNSALGKVPLIGDALVGGEDAGLLGINYSVSGNLAEPDINVNPASLLTPGFLRGVFGSRRGRLDPDELPSQTPAPNAQDNLTQ